MRVKKNKSKERSLLPEKNNKEQNTGSEKKKIKIKIKEQKTGSEKKKIKIKEQKTGSEKKKIKIKEQKTGGEKKKIKIKEQKTGGEKKKIKIKEQKTGSEKKKIKIKVKNKNIHSTYCNGVDGFSSADAKGDASNDKEDESWSDILEQTESCNAVTGKISAAYAKDNGKKLRIQSLTQDERSKTPLNFLFSSTKRQNDKCMLIDRLVSFYYGSDLCSLNQDDKVLWCCVLSHENDSNNIEQLIRFYLLQEKITLKKLHEFFINISSSFSEEQKKSWNFNEKTFSKNLLFLFFLLLNNVSKEMLKDRQSPDNKEQELNKFFVKYTFGLLENIKEPDEQSELILSIIELFWKYDKPMFVAGENPPRAIVTEKFYSKVLSLDFKNSKTREIIFFNYIKNNYELKSNSQQPALYFVMEGYRQEKRVFGNSIILIGWENLGCFLRSLAEKNDLPDEGLRISIIFVGDSPSFAVHLRLLDVRVKKSDLEKNQVSIINIDSFAEDYIVMREMIDSYVKPVIGNDNIRYYTNLWALQQDDISCGNFAVRNSKIISASRNVHEILEARYKKEGYGAAIFLFPDDLNAAGCGKIFNTMQSKDAQNKWGLDIKDELYLASAESIGSLKLHELPVMFLPIFIRDLSEDNFWLYGLVGDGEDAKRETKELTGEDKERVAELFKNFNKMEPKAIYSTKKGTKTYEILSTIAKKNNYIVEHEQNHKIESIREKYKDLLGRQFLAGKFAQGTFFNDSPPINFHEGKKEKFFQACGPSIIDANMVLHYALKLSEVTSKSKMKIYLQQIIAGVSGGTNCKNCGKKLEEIRGMSLKLAEEHAKSNPQSLVSPQEIKKRIGEGFSEVLNELSTNNSSVFGENGMFCNGKKVLLLKESLQKTTINSVHILPMGLSRRAL